MLHNTMYGKRSFVPVLPVLCFAIVIGCLMVPVTVLAQPGSNPGKPVILNGSVGFGIESDLQANMNVTVADTSDDWYKDAANTGVGVGYFKPTYPGAILPGLLSNSDILFARHVRDFVGGLPVTPTTDTAGVELSQCEERFTTGSKFNSNPNTDWSWDRQAPPNKNDVQNIPVLLTAGPTGAWLTAGGDRLATNGTSYIDFAFYQKAITTTATNGVAGQPSADGNCAISSGGFYSAGLDGGRTAHNNATGAPGDFLIQVLFSNGGSKPQVNFFEWRSQAGGGFAWDSITIIGTPLANNVFVAGNSSGAVPVSYGAFNQTSYQQFAFVEVSANLSVLLSLLSGGQPCESFTATTMVIATKASSAPTAELKDFHLIPVNITIGISPSIAVTPSCDSTQLCANLTGGTPTGYTWSGPGGFASTAQCVEALADGRYFATIATANGCNFTDSVDVTVARTPILSCAGDQINCNHTQGTACVTVSNISSIPNIQYVWSPEPVSGQGTRCASYNDSVHATVTVTNLVNNCTSSCTAVITRNANTPSLTCAGDQITCVHTSGTACVTVSNIALIPNISYVWSPTPASGQGTRCATYNDSVLAKVVVRNLDNNCADSCTARITKNTTPPSLVATGGSVTCFTPTVQLTASSTALCAKYHWTGPNGFSTLVQNPTVSDSGNYTVTVTDTCNGCRHDTTVHVANVIPQTTGDTCGAGGPIGAGFELDGNAVASPAIPGDDWDLIFNRTAQPTSTTGIVGDAPSKADDYFQKGTKDLTDVSQWMWNIQSVPDKDDILHGGAAEYGNKLYFFGDRIAVNGDAQIGFWFFKNPVDTVTGGTFIGTHAIGDLLVLSNFIQGGGTPVIFAYEWVGSGGSDGALNKLTLSAANSFAIVNSSPQPSPWPYSSKFSSAKQFPAGAFFEGGIDLACLPGINPCFATFLLETRSSQSVTASLKDFLIGKFVFGAPPNAAQIPARTEVAPLFGSGEKTQQVAVPGEYALHANYPNPFNPTTLIQYDLPEASNVRVTVFNVLGEEVATLVNGEVGAGYRTVEWNTENSAGKTIASGVYIYQMKATSLTSGQEFFQVRKMVLMK